jgi:hypothetical protein
MVAGTVPDHQRMARWAAGHHTERDERAAAKLCFDLGQVRSAELGHRPPPEWLAALVVLVAPEVHQAFLALAHEALQLLLELGVLAPPEGLGRRVLQSLDGEVDLAVCLDGHHFGLDAIVLAEMLADVPNVVPVDLRDVNQSDLAVF